MKTTKRLLCALLSVMLVLTVSFALFACDDDAPTCTSHVDNNNDLLCDNCNATVPCTNHFDNNGDMRCDRCMRPMPCTNHVDQNNDASCDKCGAYVAPTTCTSHVDANGDLKCDNCGADVACTEHVDVDGDEECDKCGAEVEKEFKELLLVEGGLANFQFVTSSGLTTDVRRFLEQDIVRTLDKDYDLDINVTTEGTSSDEEWDIEVLIGDIATRGDEYKFNRYSLGEKGYIIKIIGDKVLIHAGSDDQLIDAIQEFAEEIIGLDGDDEIFDVIMTSDDEVVEIQDNYKITSLAVNGNDMKDYTIAVDKLDNRYHNVAKNMQQTIYSRTGYWFEIVSIRDVSEKSIVLNHIDKISGDKSFAIKVVDDQLVIECAYDNMLDKATTAFLTETFLQGKGDLDFTGNVYNQDISVVYYEDFGATNNGMADDDFVAIYDTHNFANECGQTVMSRDGGSFRIHHTVVNKLVDYVSIKTNVDWTGVEFIIDDSDIDYHNSKELHHKMATTSIFVVESDYATLTYNKSNQKELLESLGSIGYSYGTTHIDLGLGYPAMLVIYNDNHKVYRRSGSTYVNTATGTNQDGVQHELILVDANGKIDPSTPFMFDYEEITKIVIYRTDVDPVTIKGGVATTIACGLDCYSITAEGKEKQFGYYARGISVQRSYTTVDGLKHFVTGEVSVEDQAQGIEGVHYRGFFYGENATDVTFKNCQVQGRRYYGVSGTYDLGGNLVNNINFIGCTQVNFWIDANGNISTYEKGELSMRWNMFDHVDKGGNGALSSKVRHCWGVGGTNYCKNMNYIDSQLSRFDAHCGLYNGSVINTDITFFAITGKGDFIVDNVRWFSAGEGATDNSLIYMRGDYGSTWEGNLVLNDVKAYASSGAFYMLFHGYNNWNYGYKCYIPNIDINNFELYSVKTKQLQEDNQTITFIYGGKNDYMHLDVTKGAGPKVIIYNEATGLYELVTDPTGSWEFDHITGKYVPSKNPIAYRNDNPIGMPDYIKITGNSHNYKFKFVKSEDPQFYFAGTKFVYGDGENDYFQGTNHDGNDTFAFG